MERLGDDVRGALRRAGAPDLGSLAAITRAWAEAVGPAIARAAWPLRIARDGTLHVATSSAAWSQELALLGPEIREKLAHALGPATELPPVFRFAVGPVPEPGHQPVERPASPLVPGPDEAEAGAAVASAISDPELRELVRRAASASLAARRLDRPV
jgi:hypothetical protein